MNYCVFKIRKDFLVYENLRKPGCYLLKCQRKSLLYCSVSFLVFEWIQEIRNVVKVLFLLNIIQFFTTKYEFQKLSKKTSCSYSIFLGSINCHLKNILHLLSYLLIVVFIFEIGPVSDDFVFFISQNGNRVV